MPVSFAVGSFQKSSATAPLSNQAHITGLSFQPKVIWVMTHATGTTNPATFQDTERPGFGWSTGPSANYCLSWGADDNNTTTAANTNTFRRARNDSCLSYGSSSSTSVPIITVESFDADGANFAYSANDTNAFRCYYMALGGSDITAVKAGEFSPNITTGNQSVTGVGFRPDIVFFMTGNSAAPPAGGASSTPHLVTMWGVAKSTTQRAVMAQTAVDNLATSDCARYQRTDRCIAYFTEGSTVMDGQADIVSLDSDGFTITWSDAPSTAQPIFYLAIQGGAWTVGSTLQRTTVGTTAVNVGYTPRGVMVMGHQGTATGVIQANSKVAMGGATSSTSTFSWCCGNMDNSTINTSYRTHTDQYLYRSHDLGTTNTPNLANADGESVYLTSSAKLQSIDTNVGFTLNWDVVDANAREVIYVTVGDNQGLALTKVQGTETVSITEAANRIKALTRVPSTTGETLSVTEGAPVRALGRLRQPTPETVSLTEAAPIAKVLKLQSVNESVVLGETALEVAVKRRVLPSETLTWSETLNKILVTPTQTLQPSALHLRYSGGVSNSVTTASRGGAMSNVSVTDNSLNNTWDDITAAQSIGGVVEYRCFYIYNTNSTMTAYNCEMWIDTTTPAGDSIEIAVGGAAMSGTEQDLTAQPETFAPNSPSLSFTTAPDPDGAIFLGNIPPLGYRSFWIKRTVPAATPSWSDNSYRLRMSFVADHI